MKDNICSMYAYEIRELILRKQVKVSEVVEAFIKQTERVEKYVNAYITFMPDEMLKQAKIVDERLAKGQETGRLAGLPVGIKDNICIKDAKTTCASKILENFFPPYDAYVIENIKREWGIISGKLNMDEFAMGSSTENSSFFATKNPWDLERVPGGSSGGSASAVASLEVPLALGSDTGGSIRQPAFMCGVVGYKPTYGLVSRRGLVAFASSLDQIGPIARCVKDVALLMDVIKGKDFSDSTSVKPPFDGIFPQLEQIDIKNIRVGIPDEFFAEGVDEEVRNICQNAIKVAEKMGCKIVKVSLPMIEYGIPTYYIIASSEASSNLARYDGVHYGYRSQNFSDVISLYSSSRQEGFGAEVKRRIMLGTFALSSGYYEAYYNRALKARRLIKQDFDNAFEKCDVIFGPTSPVAPFKLGEKIEDPLQMYLCDIFTVCTNLAGLPAISIPAGFTKGGLPVGLQIHARAFDDLRLLQVAHALERVLEIKNIPPIANNR